VIAIAGLAVGLAFGLRSSPKSTPVGPREATVGRLKLPVPRGFNSYSMPVNQGPGSPMASHAITNFRVPAGMTLDRVMSRWAAADMKYVFVENHNHGAPSNVVALKLDLDQPYGSGCIGPCPPPSVRLHLPLNANQPWEQQYRADGKPSFRDGYFRFHHKLYSVEYWVGQDAPANDRAAVLDALRSIRPAS